MTMQHHLGVTDLINRCVLGDNQARGLFFSRYRGLVRLTVRRKLGALNASAPLRAEVEDITHEVFERLLTNGCRSLANLKQPHSLNAWLMAVTQNHVVDYVRKWSGRTYRNQAAETMWENQATYGVRTDELAIEHEHEMLVESLLATLSRRDRLITESFFIHGMKYVEIAAMLDVNINTVSSILRRAKHKLHRLGKIMVTVHGE